MPEIAEVRTVAKVLKKKLINQQIKDINIIYKGILECSEDYFKKRLINNSIVDIKTNGKWLLFYLNDYVLLSHLRMEGKYFIKNYDDPILKHEHIIFKFTDFDLRYHDVRKFGKMNVCKISDLNKMECLNKLGIEPDNKKLNSSYLIDRFKNKNKPIKSVLLDQSIINGLGNIYANEVLYASGINPHRSANSLTLEECKKIVESSRKIIKEAEKMGGTTIRSYTSSLGVTGNYQTRLKVHMQQKCTKCNSKIVKEHIDGRSAYFCPMCQK